jgi:RNA polymerase sigma factor (sigma-70 family)
LYRIMWPSLVAVNQRALRGAWTGAEDVSQEVFIKLAKYCDFSRLKDGASLRSYIWAIARHTCADYVRNLMKTSQFRGDLLADTSFFANDTGSLVARADLNAVASTLSEQDQRLLNSLLNGRTINEIAQFEGIQYGNAAVRIHRLRNRLKDLYDRRLSVKK